MIMPFTRSTSYLSAEEKEKENAKGAEAEPNAAAILGGFVRFALTKI